MEQKKKETLGTVMAVCGGICWGFSGCCGQFLFETRGAKAPWLVALRLLFAGIIMIVMGFALHGKRNLDVLKEKSGSASPADLCLLRHQPVPVYVFYGH